MGNELEVVCELCGKGRLTEKVEVRKYRKQEVRLLYYICDHCEVEYSTTEQVRLNKQAFAQIKR